ncbi:hypothetical protein RHMOL_Rhmol10G0189800 [Rhododendron molle]|uniref:Uncharacterized protein n=1 Tax=Rhododendron molle TaxID=49168 RepID=A0ACC0M5F9_RHOML|nr:hypothetical protein RHMOL_Rhmol10G0189800 [Rhododendron molle]
MPLAMPCLAVCMPSDCHAWVAITRQVGSRDPVLPSKLEVVTRHYPATGESLLSNLGRASCLGHVLASLCLGIPLERSCLAVDKPSACHGLPLQGVTRQLGSHYLKTYVMLHASAMS